MLYQREIPEMAGYDVVVVGAGPAGIGAAGCRGCRIRS